MRTYEQIYNEAKSAGIVDELNRYNEFKQKYLSEGLNTNSINIELSTNQLQLLAKLQFEITGIRPGSCSGCVQDIVKNMNRWLMNNVPKPKTRKS
jgi:hypothetical protein